MTSAPALDGLRILLADKQILIADGHHRYETTLGLAPELRPLDVAAGAAASDFVMMFLARAEDPGLLVLPTHRLVKESAGLQLRRPVRGGRGGVRRFDKVMRRPRAEIETRLARDGAKRVTFAVRAPGRPFTVWLTLKSFLDLSLLGPPTLRNLDVTVLHGVILGPLLGIDAEAMANQSFLDYTHDTARGAGRAWTQGRGPGGVLHERDPGRTGAVGVRGGVRAAAEVDVLPPQARDRPLHVPARRSGAAARAVVSTSSGSPGGSTAGSTDGATDDADITSDTLRAGRVRIFQPARGARMSLDPVLLEGFLPPPHGRFLDIGCGTGALSFLLLARDPAATGVGVELQPRLAALAARGRDGNGWQPRLEIAVGDVRALSDRLGAATFDLVATNPPYRTPTGNRRPPDDERALAHQEIALALPEWVAVAARAVRPGGRVAAIFPAERAADLLAALLARDLVPCRLRSVHPHADQPASRVLVEAVRAGRRPLVIEPPLVLHAAGARYTPEVMRLLDQEEV